MPARDTQVILGHAHVSTTQQIYTYVDEAARLDALTRLNNLLAGPEPLPTPVLSVQRRVPSRGGIQVAHQRIQVGMTHAAKIVTVMPEGDSFRLVIDGETVGVVPRTTSHEIDRYRPTRPAPEGGDPMPRVSLDAADAAELAEMLQFLTGWLARDPVRLAASLEEFVGHPAYGITQLRQDLDRFVFPARRQRRRTTLRPASGIATTTAAIRNRRSSRKGECQAWRSCAGQPQWWRSSAAETSSSDQPRFARKKEAARAMPGR